MRVLGGGAALVLAGSLVGGTLGGCAAGSERAELEGAPALGRAHVVLLLAPECRLDRKGRSFVLPDGTRFAPPLEGSGELRPMVPELARRKRAQLSEDEARLARYTLFLPATDEGIGAALDRARSWPCVEEARESPKVALP